MYDRYYSTCQGMCRVLMMVRACQEREGVGVGVGGEAMEAEGALSSLVRLLIRLFLLSLILLHMEAG